MLERFLDNLIVVHRNINSNSEAEKDGHLPFLDIEIHRRLDGCLCQKALLSTLHTSVRSHMARLPFIKLSFDYIFNFLHRLLSISIFI